MEHCRFTLTPAEISACYGARMPDLRQQGARWRGACGIHKGIRGSFSVHPETGLWRCWSDCSRGGDIIALEMALTGVSWLDAVKEVERIVGRPLLNRPTNRVERRALADRLARDQRVQGALRCVRSDIRMAAPVAEEMISHQAPTYNLHRSQT